MRCRYQIAIIIVSMVVVAVLGRSATKTDDKEGDTSRPTVKKSPRVFVNTSVPFSVAPQPVKDTLEVAHAKETFMKTFQRIHDAVIAADTEHLNYTVLDDDLTNNLDDGVSRTATPAQEKETSFTSRRPAPVRGRAAPEEDSEPLPNLFPDPLLEPEYFLPSVHVDPRLLSQFNPPLPPNPYIQQIRPFTEPGMAGTCYEIILLEAEKEVFHFPRGNDNISNNTQNFDTHSSLLHAISPSVEGRTRSNQKSSPASQVIPVGTPAIPSLGSRKGVPHFKAPQLSFLTLGESQGHTGR